MTDPHTSRRPPDRATRVLLAVGFALLVASVTVSGIFVVFVRGHDRVLVVTMQQGVTQEQREQLRADCGGLPGVEPVADRGNPDPRVQSRFPVRFDITDATPAQEAALEACVDRPEVRGFLVEGDR